MTQNPPPPRLNLPILQRLVETYKLWHQYLPNIPKTARYSLGEKIDGLFIQTIESIVTATYLGRGEKQPYVLRAITKLDVLKFFLKVSWEIKAIDNKKYLAISQELDEIGRMLGGWNKQLQTTCPAYPKVGQTHEMKRVVRLQTGSSHST